MGAGHGHGADHESYHVDRSTRRALAAAAIVCALLTALAAIVTWPGEPAEDSTFNLGADLYEGTVERITDCPEEALFGADDIECFVVQVSITEGPETGQLFELPPFYESNVEFSPGDELVLARVDGPDAPFRYAFSDRNRKSSLLLLTVLFAVVVVVLGRLRGVAALAGLASTVLILGFYTLPALLEGQSALPIACVTAAMIAFVALYMSHGFTTMTTVAVLGTLMALVITVVLGVVFIDLANLTGFATEESLFILGVGTIDVSGLLLAGLVIGALGALDDMTVTQASVVFELRGANAAKSRSALFKSAMRVGQDHVASTVNTLFLAYAGASLPLLLLFSIGQLPVVDVANSEVVATEIVRTLVGSIGLVAAVPVTTWLAVRVVGDGAKGPDVPSGQRPPVRRATATEQTLGAPAGENPMSDTAVEPTTEAAMPVEDATEPVLPVVDEEQSAVEVGHEGAAEAPTERETEDSAWWRRLRDGVDD